MITKKIVFRGKKAVVSELHDKTYEDILISKKIKYTKRDIPLDIVTSIGISGYLCYELSYHSVRLNKQFYIYSIEIGMFDEIECNSFIFEEKMTNEYIQALENAFYHNSKEIAIEEEV